MTNLNNCIYWFFSYFYFRVSYNFRIFNIPLSCLFSSFSFNYYLIVVFSIWIVCIEVWVIFYCIFKRYFFFVFYFTFSVCTYFNNFLLRCFCFSKFAFLGVCNLAILDCDSCSSGFFSWNTFLGYFLFTWC